MNIKNFPTLKIENPIRISLNRIIFKQFEKLPKGKLLEIGINGHSYKKHLQFIEYKSLDIDPNLKADFTVDIQNANLPNDYFDVVVICEVIEHIPYPQKALYNIFNTLKSGGVIILTTRFCQSLHGETDFWRFTEDSLKMLFRKFIDVEIIPQGNRIQLIWTMIFGGKLAIIGNIFNHLIAKIDFKDNLWPTGYVVWARK